MNLANQLRFAFRMYMPARTRVVSICSASAVAALTEAATLVGLSALVSRISSSEDESTHRILGYEAEAGKILLAVLILAAFRMACGAFLAHASAGLNVDAVSATRLKIVKSFQSADWSKKTSMAKGRLPELIANHTNRASDLVGGVANLISAGVNMAGLLLVSAIVNPLATAGSVGLVVLLAIGLSPLRSRVGSLTRRSIEDNARYSLAVAELEHVATEVHCYGVADKTREILIADNEAWRRSTRALLFTRGLLPITYVTVSFALLGCVIWALGNGASTTDVAQAGAVGLIFIRVIGYGQGLQGAVAAVGSSAAAARSLEEALNEMASTIPVRMQAHSQKGDRSLTLQRISFAYSSGSPVADRLDLSISPGEVVGLVGASGAGKSTLALILAGLLTPQSGNVLVDAVPWSLSAPPLDPPPVAFLGQAHRIVRGSVRDNIVFFRSGVSAAEVERAASLAGLSRELEAWPGGLDHDLGESGGDLSGGQAQRICIARALVGRPQYLILDEPTSALDDDADATIVQTVRSLADVGILLISHRKSTLMACTRVVELSRGQLVQSPVRLS